MSPSLFSRLETALARVVTAERKEIPALVASFFYFFAVLTAYYIIRPVRDEMGLMLGANKLKDVFIIVFIIMLLAIPLFGWIVSTFERRRVVPTIYGFFILNLLGYWLFLRSGAQTPLIANSFFVWAAVFNLFVISLFWSVMSSTWTSDQAKRLYGFISAGGTIGALTGPAIAQALATTIGRSNMLLVAATFLILALAIALYLQTYIAPSEPATAQKHEPATIRSIFAGALRVWESPYLFRVALWVFLANVISTFFYFEQANIVGAAIENRDLRVQFLARMDFAVSILTIIIQVFLTARIMDKFGLGFSAATLPFAAIIGFIALAISPTLWVIVAIIVIERAVTFSLASPAAKVLYTTLAPDDKYKAQNFIDTVVYRGGDALSGTYFDILMKKFGLGFAGVAVVTIPLAGVWLGLSFVLERMFKERQAKELQSHTQAAKTSEH
ncbi:MAG: MFS transporter [Hyphomicrobiaceae bacterium]|nr:MFS transporter [Hyphomicrobiaceae bacterium]